LPILPAAAGVRTVADLLQRLLRLLLLLQLPSTVRLLLLWLLRTARH